MKPQPTDESILPVPHQVDFEYLKTATDESAYLKEAFELLREVTAWVGIGISIREKSQPEAMERNQAICAGQLVRMCKIMRICMKQIADDHGGDHQMALSREFIESASTAAFLLEDVTNEARFTSYLHDSLIQQRELLGTVRKLVKARNGVRLAIEDRMERSVQATVKRAGIELEDIPGRKQNGWDSVETRVRLLGPAAYDAYRAGSSAVHGTWADLDRNHLEVVDGGFVPKYESDDFRPQPLLMMGVLGTVVLRKYLHAYGPSEAAPIADVLDDLEERIRALDVAHEQYLNM